MMFATMKSAPVQPAGLSGWHAKGVLDKTNQRLLTAQKWYLDTASRELNQFKCKPMLVNVG